MQTLINQLLAEDHSCVNINFNTALVQINVFIHGELGIVSFANSIIFIAFKMTYGSVQTF